MNSIFKKQSLLLVYSDLTGFVKLCKELSDEEVFLILRKTSEIAISFSKKHNGKILKFMGDGVFFIFPEESLSETVADLFFLKSETEALLKKMKINSRLGITAHFGEVIFGNMGNEEHSYFDVIGKAVNTLFLSVGKPWQGKIVLTPQAFRKLKIEDRKKFHKYTPQISYVGE